MPAKNIGRDRQLRSQYERGRGATRGMPLSQPAAFVHAEHQTTVVKAPEPNKDIVAAVSKSQSMPMRIPNDGPYLRFDLVHMARKSAFSFTPSPTRLTRPRRANASAILSMNARSSLVVGPSESSPPIRVLASLEAPSELRTSTLVALAVGVPSRLEVL